MTNVALPWLRGWLALISLVTPPGIVVAQTTPSVAQVFREWKKRQDAVSTARFEWTASTTYAKGCEDADPLAIPRRAGETAPIARGPLPPEDTTCVNKVVLCLHDNKVRFTIDGLAWIPSKAKFLSRQYISVFDGAVLTSFFGPAAEGVYPKGFRGSTTRSDEVDNYNLWPVFMNVRPLSDCMEKRFARSHDWRIGEQPAIISGRRCLIMEKQDGNRVETCWIDSVAPHVIRRLSITMRNRPLCRLDVDYRNDPLHGLLPSGWRQTWFYQEATLVRDSCTADVTAAALNIPIDMNEFRFEFPEGTMTSEGNEGELYLMRTGGAKRRITQEELARGAGYEELLATESGMAMIGSQSSWRWIFVLVAFGCVSLLFFGRRIFWRKKGVA